MENTNDFIYLTIPEEYICTYHKLLNYMADFGKTVIDDCNASCKGSGKNILTCWNLFQSALAAYELGRTKEADFFINYIEKQLKLIYKNAGENVNVNVFPTKIDENGHVKLMIGCGTVGMSSKEIFIVNPSTGRLMQDVASSPTNKVYTIENNNLICTKTE